MRVPYAAAVYQGSRYPTANDPTGTGTHTAAPAAPAAQAGRMAQSRPLHQLGPVGPWTDANANTGYAAAAPGTPPPAGSAPIYGMSTPGTLGGTPAAGDARLYLPTFHYEGYSGDTAAPAPTAAGGSAPRTTSAGGSGGYAGASTRVTSGDGTLDIPYGVDANWYRAFMAEHPYTTKSGQTINLTPEQVYDRDGEYAIAHALSDKAWGEQFARTYNRAPTDYDWKASYYDRQRNYYNGG
jgi:hypothetical protein